MGPELVSLIREALPHMRSQGHIAFVCDALAGAPATFQQYFRLPSPACVSAVDYWAARIIQVRCIGRFNADCLMDNLRQAIESVSSTPLTTK